MVSLSAKDMTLLEDKLGETKRIMVKIGTDRIVDFARGNIDLEWMRAIAKDLSELGKEFAMTSSGAIGAARITYDLPAPETVQQKQAYAAMGQPVLMNCWRDAFKGTDFKAAQILLTHHDVNHHAELRKIRGTMTALRNMRAAAIINENDTLATEEIKIGDNDQLSAHGAVADEADLLIILTNLDGFYTADPRMDSTACHIAVIRDVTQDIWNAAGGASGDHARGGMHTKLLAAQIAARQGIDTIIMSGKDGASLSKLFNGTTRCTYIPHTAFDDKKAKKQTPLTMSAPVHGRFPPCFGEV